MKNRGFTLIELLATVLISSIIIIAAYQLITSTTGTFRDENIRRELDSNLRNVELLIQRDLSRVGFGAGMHRTGVDPTMCRAAFMGTETPQNDYLSFEHYRNNNGFSEFRIIASISDFDGFHVSSFSGGALTIDPSVKLPLVAAQVSAHDYKNQFADASNHMFASVFNRMFNQYVYAAEISTPDGGSILVPIQGVNISGGKYTIRLPANLNFVGCGINAAQPLVDSMVNPVLIIIYRVIPMPAGNQFRLVRCIGNDLNGRFNHAFNENNTAHWNCETLIENIQYFDIFPINRTQNLNLNNTLYTGAGNVTMNSNVPLTAADRNNNPIPGWNIVSDAASIGNLTGFVYRFGATSTEESRNEPNHNGVFPPHFGNHLYSHVRGSAVIRSNQ